MVLLVCEALLFGVLVFCDMLVARMSLKKHSASGKSLGVTCIGAAIVTASYLLSVFVEDYFLYSVLSSIYFIGIDLSLMALLYFVRCYVMGEGLGRLSLVRWALYVWSVADMILLLINPFVEVSISYIHVEAPISHYTYEMHLPYQLHLLLSYVLLGVVMFYLLRKVLTVPHMYRRQYIYAILTLVLVILINAVYLYVPVANGRHILDYSLLGYSIAAFLFYWIAFTYSEHGQLDLLRDHVFTNLDRGILLFDYEDKLILKNGRADEMLAGLLRGREPEIGDMERLFADAGVNPASLDVDGQKHSFQVYLSDAGNAGCPVACDYYTLTSKKNEILGKMFMFSDLTSEYDVLTGFYTLDTYQRQGRDVCPQIVTVAACDINALTELNNRVGRAVGDQAIQTLARLMRRCFPAGTVFVRGGDAKLIAVCDSLNEEEVRACINNVQLLVEQETVGGRPFAFQSGIKTCEEGVRRIDALNGAIEALRMRKLLDKDALHSEVLYSLVRMLQACDNDTEEHVRRTQRLGTRLGERVGLSEEQQSNLALLALLHDIGKVGIPLDILNKPGKLTEAEWNVLATHVEKGYQIASSSPELRGIADMILYHHERWDGKGYPIGLSKESIPLLSRVIAVVDSYDAMVNDRSYRRAMSPLEACRELKRCAGTQFDPSLVTEFLQMLLDDGVIEEIPAVDVALKTDVTPATDERDILWSMEPSAQEERSTTRVHVMRFARYILDAHERIVEANDTFTQLTGYTQEDIRDLKLNQLDLIFKEDRDQYADTVFTELEKDGAAYLEHWIRRKDGSALFVFCCGRRYYSSAEREEQSEIFLSDSMSSYSVQSIVHKEHGKAYRRLERWENKFRRDPLTGLLNHEAFKNDVETRLLAGETRALMLMMDVDRFKEYNDTYGHRAGDEFLVMVAQTLMSALRDSDFACRMGGDEFAALLFFQNETSRQTMEQRAAQILDKINLVLTNLGRGGTSISMGGAFLDDDCRSFDKLYEAADKALYRSKDAGRAKLSF